MKKILLVIISFGTFVTSFAQSENKKRPTLGINFILNDFKTAANLRTGGLPTILKSKEWHKSKNMTAGIGISYLQGLNNYLDFAGTLSGTFTRYPVPGKVLPNDNELLLEGAATVNLKLIPDNYWVSPYLTLGAGASKYKGYYGAFIPAGIGFQINLFDETMILVNSQYRIPVTENVAYHFFHSFGVATALTKKKEPAPVAPPPPPVVEAPKDRDGDGVLDVDDKCPDVAGLARYQGCPIPDTDKDGINDEVDKCPSVPGVARYQGCPIPDTDGDGVNDEEDKCINEKGPASNFGCPVIDEKIVARVNKAAQNVFFATGSSKLLAKSFPKLNDVVTILKENSTYKVNIDGHTDNTGKADKNQTLSNARAASVKTYLVSKGVDESRLTSMGYGQDKPIADNKTATGRARNRRVEMSVRNY
jgi:outer membrane protein OmpA-like peptidoglycan-associated protein